MRTKLTEAAVAKLKPPEKGQIDYQDDYMPRLILRINYGGRKTWQVLHYVKRPGKAAMPIRHSLGRYPTVSLKEARELARQFDPRKAKAATTGTFREVAEKFFAIHVSKLRTGRDYERILRTLVFPCWQDRNFKDIRRGDVAALLDRVAIKNGPRQADMVLAYISKMFNWYATRDEDYQTPIVRGMQRGERRRRERWLTDDECRALWAVCESMGTFGAIVRTLLVTGQRKAKVTKMRWSDLSDGAWRIPRQPREKGTPDQLTLPQLALDVIEAQPHIAGNPYVFAASVGNGPFNGFQLKRRLDAKMPEGTKPWCLHDLRRTARALMSRAGVRGDVGELVLGHAIPGVRGVYDNPAEYQQQIDAAVQAVADQIERIIGGNVVRLPNRAS